MSRLCKILMVGLRCWIHFDRAVRLLLHLPTQQSIPLFLQGFGVCEFTSRQDAQDAIEKLDQSELQGTPGSACLYAAEQHVKKLLLVQGG